MSRFRITKFDVTENEIEGYTTISMDIAVRGGATFETLDALRDCIEGKHPDWKGYALTTNDRFKIKKVIFNSPATIVFWADGTKTVVKCQDGDIYSPETGIAMCFMKKALGNKSNFNNTFKKHVPAAMVEYTLSDDILTKPLKQLSGRYPWNTNNGKKKSTRSYAHLNSEAVYRILRENKSTIPELAKSVGVDKTSVYSWLRGGGITKRNISKLVKVLHVPEEVIIKEKN